MSDATSAAMSDRDLPQEKAEDVTQTGIGRDIHLRAEKEVVVHTLEGPQIAMSFSKDSLLNGLRKTLAAPFLPLCGAFNTLKPSSTLSAHFQNVESWLSMSLAVWPLLEIYRS